MSESELKRCPFCAEEIQAAAILCRFCNRDLAGSLGAAYSPLRSPLSQTPQAPNDPSFASGSQDRGAQASSYQPKPRSNSRRWFWVVFVVVLTVIAGLNGQNLFTYVTGTLSGQVIIDTSKLTKNITEGIKAQSGLDVNVSCPSPFVGHVGDTRKCSYTSLMGPGFIDVTIQSTSGDITWQAE